jgi:2-keto-4-pentenoate hydratase/2-oxohepta-3-ene-1,7-dioic acid hydratase in catechol pathway
VRIYRYVSQRGGFQPRLAVAHGEATPVDLLDAWGEVNGSHVDPDIALPLVSTSLLIGQGPDMWNEVAEVARQTAGTAELDVRVDPATRWLCPLDGVSSLRDFLAFEDHVERGASRRGGVVPPYWYEAPIYYKGNHQAILGPEDECPWPDYTEWVDFELELALIVGRRGRDVPSSSAADHIFGFTVFNDFSARDVQAKEISAWLGPSKGKDFANALGPCIVTVDEVGTEPDLEMVCRVNGEEWGRGRSGAIHWKWADIIAHVSRGEDIYPADVYGSGTPGGCCGLDLDRRLQPGDVVELEIEKIGILRNPIATRS